MKVLPAILGMTPIVLSEIFVVALVRGNIWRYLLANPPPNSVSPLPPFLYCGLVSLMLRNKKNARRDESML